MNRVKELEEKRGAKLQAAAAIINTAQNEKRELSAEELGKVKAFHAEAESINDSAIAELRQLSLEGKKQSLSQGEKRDLAKFDLGAVLRGMRDGNRFSGLEAEIIAEGVREARDAGLGDGIYLPRLMVRDMTAGTANQGGDTVATMKSGLLDDFFDASVVREMGATYLEGLVGNLDIPRLTAGTAPAKKAENATADEVSPTVGKVTLTPKRLPAFIDVSDQLLRQSSSAIESVVRNHLTAQLLGIMEAGLINGGGTQEPTGILQTGSIGSVAGGTNGAAPTWANIVALETAVAVNNAALGSVGYLTNAKVRGKLKTTSKAGTEAIFVWGEQNTLNGYRTGVTNAVPSNLVKGSSGTVCSAIVFGNFADLFVGFWGGLELSLVRDASYAKQGLSCLVANVYYDAAVARPKSFAAMLDALTT